MKIALAQINPVIGDFKGNELKIKAFAQKAKDLLCSLVIFPELSICGYPPKDLLEKNNFLRDCQKCADRLVQSIQGIGVIIGYVDVAPDSHGKSIYNAAILFEDGRVLHKAYKRLLPSYDVFDETRYFAPGFAVEPFAYKGLNLGLTICEDAWNDEDFFSTQAYAWDPVKDLVANNTDIIINIAASPFHAGKRNLRARLMAHLAEKYLVPCVYVNQVGGNDHLLFDGASTVHAPGGKLVARAMEFEEDLVVYDTATSAGNKRPACDSDAKAVEKALVMGVGDYVRKCGFTSVIIGLSGGIDSALTLAIAVNALGPENVLAIFMPSKYTSPQNFVDTKELCANFDCNLEIIPITPIFEEFLQSLGPLCSKDNPGITEQNLQARIRGTILMAWSNQHGAMVLATGNKSEIAVGYCTLYGDMAGGLCVISDLPKAMVYEVSEHINKDREIIPQSIITKAPSAELAPGQTDQDDLPAYEILDSILHAYIEELKGPVEIIAMGFEPEVVRDVVQRVVKNEYKRHQAPPGLRITPKAFGEGRRYPMAHRYHEDEES